jgi:hypothetical protein
MPTPTTTSESFPYDAFLGHSAKDEAVVRPLAERLRQDGPCMSAHAFGSDWAQLACPAAASERRGKAGTFRCRVPLNQERRFIPLRLDDATGSRLSRFVTGVVVVR